MSTYDLSKNEIIQNELSEKEVIPKELSERELELLYYYNNVSTNRQRDILGYVKRSFEFQDIE